MIRFLEALKQKLKSLTTAIKDGICHVFERIKNFVIMLWGGLVKFLLNIYHFILNFFVNIKIFLSKIVQGVYWFFRSIKNSLGASAGKGALNISKFLSDITTFLNKTAHSIFYWLIIKPFQLIRDFFKAIGRFFCSVTKATLDFFKKMIIFIGNAINKTIFLLIIKPLQLITDFFKALFFGFINGILSIFYAIKNFFNAILQAFLSPFKKVKKIHSAIKSFSNENHLQVDKKDERYITDSKAALMNETNPGANKTIIAVVAFVTIGVIWAYFGEIDQTITGSGVVIPSSHVKIIQSLDGGLLEAIYVKEGQIVQKDQKLLEMDDTRYKAEYQQLYEQYITLMASIARLTAETQDKDQIIFPAELKNRQSLIETEDKLFHTRRQALKNDLEILQESYDLANQEVAMYKPLIKTGVSSQLELLRAERAVNELQSRMSEKQGKFREDAWAELKQRQGELAVAKERLLGLKDKMVRTTITSPVYGIIKKINVVTVGAVIQPAVNIMEIVPLEDFLLVQAKVDSADIGFVQIGAPVSVKIDAYDYSIYGDLKGTVQYISADIIEENEKGVSPRSARYYLVNVRTAHDYIVHDGKKLPIIPGMTANIQITVGKRTLFQYIMKPVIKVKSEALRER